MAVWINVSASSINLLVKVWVGYDFDTLCAGWWFMSHTSPWPCTEVNEKGALLVSSQHRDTRKETRARTRHRPHEDRSSGRGVEVSVLRA